MNKDYLAKYPVVPISWGELVDKLTILEIKQAHIVSALSLSNVQVELRLLNEIVENILAVNQDLLRLKEYLAEINQKLWHIEDSIRQKEASKDFGLEFIELARAVYKTNDRRALIKKEINQMMASAITEEKHYAPY